MEFYTYAFLDPRKPGLFDYDGYEFDHEPFYVGKGTGRRCNIINYDRSVIFKDKIIEIRETTNQDPIIIKIDVGVSEREAFESEVFVINIIGRSDLRKGPLLNLSDGGCAPPVMAGKANPHYGKPRSKETRRKISEALKGRTIPKEVLIKRSLTTKGRKLSEEQRKLISERMKKHNHRSGTKASDETRKKMSESQKKRWSLKERTFSEEHKRKLSEAHKSKWKDPEYRKMILQSRRKE